MNSPHGRSITHLIRLTLYSTLCVAIMAEAGQTARAWDVEWFESLFKALQAGADPNSHDADGRTFLILAAVKGRYDAVELLLERGANPNMPGPNGITALMAAANGGHDRVAKTLLASGADVNATDENGTSALMYAVDSGNVSVVRTILNAGGEVRARDKWGRTPGDRRRKTTQGIVTGSMADGTLKTRYFSYRVRTDDPILRLLGEFDAGK